MTAPPTIHRVRPGLLLLIAVGLVLVGLGERHGEWSSFGSRTFRVAAVLALLYGAWRLGRHTPSNAAWCALAVSMIFLVWATLTS